MKKINKNKYELKVGETIVEIVYPETTKKFNDCLLNILKLKMK